MKRPTPRERLAAAELRLARIGADIANSQSVSRAGLRRIPAWLLLGGAAGAGAIVGRIGPPLPALLPFAQSALRWGLTLASLATAGDAANDAEAARAESGHGD